MWHFFFQFFSAMVACFSTNFLLSAFEGHPTHLSNPGLVRFNTFPVSFDLCLYEKLDSLNLLKIWETIFSLVRPSSQIVFNLHFKKNILKSYYFSSFG